MKVSKNWNRKPSDKYVHCSVCGRDEGNIVQDDNELTDNEGRWADFYRSRGWRFEGGKWTCPMC